MSLSCTAAGARCCFLRKSSLPPPTRLPSVSCTLSSQTRPLGVLLDIQSLHYASTVFKHLPHSIRWTRCDCRTTEGTKRKSFLYKYTKHLQFSAFHETGGWAFCFYEQMEYNNRKGCSCLIDYFLAPHSAIRSHPMNFKASRIKFRVNARVRIGLLSCLDTCV